MSDNTYFHNVKEQTPTRFWINNPTLEQAKQAIASGAIGCTTNPSYVSKLFSSEEDYRCVLRAIDLLVPYEDNDSVVASKVQQMMVERLSDLFLPMYKQSGGTEGLVTIQGDPFTETNTKAIIDEGLENRTIGENVCIKIPVTEWGIEAISAMVERNIPTMATEVMALSQVVSICEAYSKASKKSKNHPPFYVTHITGILDDHFKRVIDANHLKLPPSLVKYAGLSIAKAEYALLKERNYPGIMIGGGARKLEDFTELVGGNLSITINWKGTAETLIEKNQKVESRIDENLSETEIQHLIEQLPDYQRAYSVTGMVESEYYEYGGVELFRTSFQKGWNELLALIRDRRKKSDTRKKHRGSLSSDPRMSRAKGIDRVTLTYDDDNMMCYFYLQKGSKLEMHTHVQSQSGIVVKGHILFLKGDGEVLDLKAGDAYYFASMDPHGSELLEDTELIECFAPSRDDYKD